jgi:hypothetical protein
MDSSNCAICMDTIGESNTCKLECGHTFHYTCIFQWNKNNENCPYCRNKTVPSIYNTNENNSEIDEIDEIDEIAVITEKILEETDVWIICRECNFPLEHCENCSDVFCKCSENHTNNTIKYIGKNPFDPESSETTHCSKCFIKRDELLLSYLMDDWEFDVYSMDFMVRIYDTFYKDTSKEDNTLIYINYNTYDTYEEFIEYGNTLKNSELNALNDSELNELNDSELEVQIDSWG